MPLIFLEEPGDIDLYPFTETRSVQDIRIGILTIREKWEAYGFKISDSFSRGVIKVPADLIPNPSLISSLTSSGESFVPTDSSLKLIHPWQIFQYNDICLREDFKLLTQGRTSESIPATVNVLAPSAIFLEHGAKLDHATLNASTGPIYIGKNAEIMEGSLIRGPFAACEGSVLKMGSKIYGATTIGPYSVVGGEIKNSVLFGFSNKAHDGYLGDSVIGEWCNLGAGTSNSNMTNAAGPVKVWSNKLKSLVTAGSKVGLLMGDYSRSAINTSFNTGTVVGPSCSVFGEGLTPKHIPAFSRGNKELTTYDYEKAIRDIASWKKLKNQELSTTEIERLKAIFDKI